MLIAEYVFKSKTKSLKNPFVIMYDKRHKQDVLIIINSLVYVIMTTIIVVMMAYTEKPFLKKQSLEAFSKKGVLKNFAKFTRKHL